MIMIMIMIRYVLYNSHIICIIDLTLQIYQFAIDEKYVYNYQL